MSLFLRSDLITLGAFLAAGGLALLFLDSRGTLSIVFTGGIVAGATAALGLALLLVGLIGNPATVERWADRVSVHEGSLFVAIVALPLFLLLRLFMRADRRPPATLPVAEFRGRQAKRRQGLVRGQKRRQ
ncbi:hypothetical protein ACQKKX_00245 [Neorhizobium sp. NPDC001467]|uniref:hypothetical protein n=1 Tax=Neorhizobium sp. NPDC001467 TaxID=3390595 RepID=UPI003D02C00A